MTSEFDQRIRAARPVSGHRALPLSDRARRELAALLLADSADPVALDIADRPDEPDSTAAPVAPETPTDPAGSPDDRRHPPARGDSTRPQGRKGLSRALRRGDRGLRRRSGRLAVAVVLLAATLFGATLARPTQAWAATPPLLAVTPVAGTASDLLNQLANAAAASGDPVPTGDVRIKVQAWVLETEDDGKALATTVAPQEYTIDRRADGSYTSVTTTGPPTRYTDGAAPNGDAPPEGTELSRLSYGPGEYAPLFPEPLPTTAQQVEPYFAPLLGPDAPVDASTLFQDIPLLLMDYVPGGAERAALLRYLASLPGVEVEGEVTDRLGRTGVMFGAHRAGDGDIVDYLVISPRSGKIVACETHYTGHDRTDIRSPSVISYFAWK